MFYQRRKNNRYSRKHENSIFSLPLIFFSYIFFMFSFRVRRKFSSQKKKKPIFRKVSVVGNAQEIFPLPLKIKINISIIHLFLSKNHPILFFFSEFNFHQFSTVLCLYKMFDAGEMESFCSPSPAPF